MGGQFVNNDFVTKKGGAMSRVMRAVFSVVVFLSSFSVNAESCVWYGAKKETLFQIRSSTDSVALSVHAEKIEALAMNARDCGVWAANKNKL